MPRSSSRLSVHPSAYPTKKYTECLESGVLRIQGFPESGPSDSSRHQLDLLLSVLSLLGAIIPPILPGGGPCAPARVFHSSRLHLGDGMHDLV